MTLHYRKADPSDLRDLGELYAEWLAAGNPKADEWEAAPPQPSPDAVWVDGAWNVPPPPPSPQDWAGFKKAMLTSPNVKVAMLAAWPEQPQAVIALPAALLRAEDGNPSDFGGCWRAILATVPAAAALVPGLAQAAKAANLPEEFIGAIRGERVRARDAQGRFIADDPATPDVDEAWV